MTVTRRDVARTVIYALENQAYGCDIAAVTDELIATRDVVGDNPTVQLRDIAAYEVWEIAGRHPSSTGFLLDALNAYTGDNVQEDVLDVHPDFGDWNTEHLIVHSPGDYVVSTSGMVMHRFAKGSPWEVVGRLKAEFDTEEQS